MACLAMYGNVEAKGQRSLSVIFLCHSSILLKQGLLLNLQLISWIRLTGQLVPRIHVSLPCNLVPGL